MSNYYPTPQPLTLDQRTAVIQFIFENHYPVDALIVSRELKLNRQWVTDYLDLLRTKGLLKIVGYNDGFERYSLDI